MSETEELALGQFAAGVLKDERFTALITTLRDRYIHDWQQATEPVARELAWHRTKVLDDLVKELEKAAQRPRYTEAQRTRLTDSH